MKKQKKLHPSEPEERTTITVDVPEGTENFYDKQASELQENINISETGEVTGKSKYIKNYTNFSGNGDEQEGNFLAIKIKEATKGNNVTFELSNAKSKGTGTIEDGFLVVRITDKNQTITIKRGQESKVLNLEKLELDVESA